MDNTANATRRLRVSWGWAVVMAVVTGVVFQSARHGALLTWDDDINITQNPHLRGLSWSNVGWMFTDTGYMRRYVPLTWLDWALDYELFGLTARSCHVGNIVLHAANAVLVFLLVRRVIALWRPRDLAADGAVNFAAGIGALVWAVHPLRVEVVAWASGRIYCQAGFFLLLATLAYLNAAALSPSPRARRWRMLSIAAFAASLLTYPLGISYVAVLVVADVWLLRRFRWGVGIWRDAQNRAVLVEKLPFVAVTVLVVAITVLARFQASGLWEKPTTFAEFGAGARAMQAFYIWAYYVWRPFVPVDLAPVYTTLVEFNPIEATFVAGAVVVIAITAVLARKRREWPGLFALWMAHLVFLAPMLGLTEHPHYPNDRYSYLQGVLWAIAIAGGLASLKSRGTRRVVGSVAVMAVVALSALSTVQIRIWRDSETLFRYLHEKLAGDTYRADIAVRLGETLRAQSRFNEAALYYAEALQLEPSPKVAGVAHVGLGVTAEVVGKPDVAIRHYEQALRFDGSLTETRAALARLRASSRR